MKKVEYTIYQGMNGHWFIKRDGKQIGGVVNEVFAKIFVDALKKSDALLSDNLSNPQNTETKD